MLNIDLVEGPPPIKTKLRELSTSISFEKESHKGANGWLFFGTNLVHQQRVAVKFYDWGGDARYHAEPTHLASLDSPNIISISDAAFVDENYAYFLTPFYKRGDLDDELERGIHENLRTVSLIRDVLSGLSHLHASNLLHRDLKPQNLLVANDESAVLGDFGSVKRLPEGHATVPGSGHSLIYRPPESVKISEYGVSGDIYQVGLLLYQLLGGKLPYEESAWLNSRQLKRYRKIEDPVDRQLFANGVIKERIKRGRILSPSSLPPWVCKELRRTISKACNANPVKRYQSCTQFLARIGTISPSIRDWRIEEGCPVCRNDKTYRIVTDLNTGTCYVEKRKTGSWRRDNSFKGNTLAELVQQVDERIC